MKENVALYIPDLNKFYSKGKPTKAITTVDSYFDGLDVKDMIYLSGDILDSYFIKNNYLCDVDKYLEIIGERWQEFYGLSQFARNYYKRTSCIPDSLDYYVNCAALSKGINAVPFSSNKWESKDFVYEYDVHACLPAMLMFTYYLDKKCSVHAEHPSCVNPMKDVHEVTYMKIHSDTHLVPYVGQKNCKKFYLCSKLNKNYKMYSDLLQFAITIITNVYKEYKIDIHRIVYGILLGSLLLVLPTKEKIKTLSVARSLMQLSSWHAQLFEINEHSLDHWYDAVYLRSYDKKMETISKNLRARYIIPYKKVPGQRYLSEHKITNYPLVIDSKYLYDPEQFVKIYRSNIDDCSENDISLRGWCSYSTKDLNIGRLFHIDIHNAYPHEYYNITGKTIDKKRFGIVKCIDIELYQSIRKSIAEKSLDILNSFENTLIYWRTDGGIVLAKDDKFIKDLKIKYPDLLVEEIYETTPLFLHESLVIPEKLKNTDIASTRLFGYKIYTADGDRIEFVNNFKDLKEQILKENNLLELKNYATSVLVDVLTHRRVQWTD